MSAARSLTGSPAIVWVNGLSRLSSIIRSEFVRVDRTLRRPANEQDLLLVRRGASTPGSVAGQTVGCFCVGITEGAAWPQCLAGLARLNHDLHRGGNCCLWLTAVAASSRVKRLVINPSRLILPLAANAIPSAPRPCWPSRCCPPPVFARCLWWNDPRHPVSALLEKGPTDSPQEVTVTWPGKTETHSLNGTAPSRQSTRAAIANKVA